MAETNSALGGRTSGRLALAAAWCVVTAFAVWTAVSDNVSWRFGAEQADYYNLLVDGFLEGQLSLKAEVPPELLASADPYDPDKRPEGAGLHDASLYRGKYYIYYGVVPAALLLLPFRVASGVDLPLKAAVLTCVVAGYTLALLVLAGMWRAYFPRVRPWAVAGLAVTVGVCSCTAILLRRGSMYELPIASGYGWAMAALFFLWRALEPASQRRGWWLAACGVAWGCAIGSRPTYLLAPAATAIAVWWIDGGRARWRNLAALVAPLAVIGLALAWYNYARFGDPKEFGVSYILSGVYEAKVEHFRARYVGWNAWAYFLAPSEWSTEFPFFRGAEITAARPRQHFGMDIPFGLLWHVPFLLLALAAPLGWWRLAVAGNARVRWAGATGAIAGTEIATLALLLMFYAAMVRYVTDFMPALVLLAAVGAMEWLERGRRAAGWMVGLMAAASGVMVVLFSLRVYDRFAAFNPAGYETVARWFGTRPAAESAASVGPNLADGVRLRVTFPRGVKGREPLLVTGRRGRGNVLALDFVSEGRVRLVFEHWGRQPQVGPEIDYVPGASCVITVRHPLYSQAGSRRVAVGEHPLTVEMDGQRVWSVVPLFYPARRDEFYVGVEPLGFSGVERRFAGGVELAEPTR